MFKPLDEINDTLQKCDGMKVRVYEGVNDIGGN